MLICRSTRELQDSPSIFTGSITVAWLMLAAPYLTMANMAAVAQLLVGPCDATGGDTCLTDSPKGRAMLLRAGRQWQLMQAALQEVEQQEAEARMGVMPAQPRQPPPQEATGEMQTWGCGAVTDRALMNIPCTFHCCVNGQCRLPSKLSEHLCGYCCTPSRTSTVALRPAVTGLSPACVHVARLARVTRWFSKRLRLPSLQPSSCLQAQATHMRSFRRQPGVQLRLWSRCLARTLHTLQAVRPLRVPCGRWQPGIARRSRRSPRRSSSWCLTALKTGEHALGLGSTTLSNVCMSCLLCVLVQGLLRACL